MRIEFNDKSYLECYKSEDNKITMILSAKDYNNPLKRITNSVELSIDEFKKIIDILL